MKARVTPQVIRVYDAELLQFMGLMDSSLKSWLVTSKSFLHQSQHFVKHVEVRKSVQLSNNWYPFCSLCPFGSNLQEASNEFTWIAISQISSSVVKQMVVCKQTTKPKHVF